MLQQYTVLTTHPPRGSVTPLIYQTVPSHSGASAQVKVVWPLLQYVFNKVQWHSAVATERHAQYGHVWNRALPFVLLITTMMNPNSELLP